MTPLPARPDRRRRGAACCSPCPSLVYALFYLAPGDPARLACGQRCTPGQIAQVARAARASTTRCYVQYWHFLRASSPAATTPAGTGRCCTAPRPASGSRTRTTSRSPSCSWSGCRPPLSLALGAMVLWLVLGVGTGLLSALRRGRLTERALTVLTLAGTATPVFVIGLLLLMVVCAYAAAGCPSRRTCRSPRTPSSGPGTCCCPGSRSASVEARQVRPADPQPMLETLAEDHIRTFRAYGVGERAIVGPARAARRAGPGDRAQRRRLRHDDRRRRADRDAVRAARARPEAGRRGATSSTCPWWSAWSWSPASSSCSPTPSPTCCTRWPTDGWCWHERTLVEVTDLDRRLPRRRRSSVRAVDGLSFTLEPGARARPRRRVRLRQVHRRLRSARAAPGHRRRVGGTVRVAGTDVQTASDDASCGGCAAATAAMVFQDPLSSLDPYYADRRPDRRGVPGAHRTPPGGRPAARAVEVLRPGRHPRRGAPRPGAPARVQRRHAAAGADRHGAGLRAAAADRRRADHRAGRHRAGPDPRPAARAARRDRAWHCCWSPTTSASSPGASTRCW